MRKPKKAKGFTQEQYDQIDAELREERGKIADLYLEARLRRDIPRCEELYACWRQMATQHMEYLLSHPPSAAV